MPHATGFTSFLIALCHHRELLDTFHENPDEAFSGWDLTQEQQEILKRGNLEEIQREVQQQHPDAAAAFWVMASAWVTGDAVMAPEDEDEDEDEDEGYSAT